MYSFFACIFYSFFIAFFLQCIRLYLLHKSVVLRHQKDSKLETDSVYHFVKKDFSSSFTIVSSSALLLAFSAMPAGNLPALLPPPFSGIYLISIFFIGCFVYGRRYDQSYLGLFWCSVGPGGLALAAVYAYAFFKGIPGMTRLGLDALTATSIWSAAEVYGKLGIIAAFFVCLAAAPHSSEKTPPLPALLWRFFYAHVLTATFFSFPFPLPSAWPLPLALFLQVLFMWGKTTILALFVIPLCQKKYISPYILWIFAKLAVTAFTVDIMRYH